jgi:hypothetical protein
MNTLILAAACAIMQMVPTIPGQKPSKNVRSRYGVESKAKTKRNLAVSPTPVKLATPTENQNSQTPQATTPQPVVVRELPSVTVNPDWWNRWYVIFTGTLVVVGAVGAGLAYKTLRAIGHQADLMRDQLTAMQGQLTVMDGQLALAARQWVAVNNWTAAVSTKEKEAMEVTVGFDIVNPTRLPLTLEMVETKGNHITVASKGRISLIPDGTYRFHTAFPLPQEMVKEFVQILSLTLPIQIAVWFSNELKMPQEQYFGGILLYGDDLNGEHTEFFPRTEMTSSKYVEQDKGGS